MQYFTHLDHFSKVEIDMKSLTIITLVIYEDIYLKLVCSP